MKDKPMRIWASRLGFIALTVLISLSIGWQILSVFMLYDDEGYVLHSLNEFARTGALYDHVFSQYGPLYYLLAGGAAWLIGFEWTHDLSRIVTGLAWLATALAGGMLTFRLSGSRLAGAIGFAATSAHLGQMAHEPMHPGNLLTPLIAGGTVVSAYLWERGRHGGFMVCVAALAAACALVKINVGVFVAMAGGMWWWQHSAAVKLRPDFKSAMGMAVSVLLPTLLLHRHLDTAWGITFVFLTSTALGTVVWLTHRDPRRVFALSHLVGGFAVGLVIVVSVLAATIASGTSGAALWVGTVAGPLQHADVYSFGPNWRPGTFGLSLISFVAFIIAERRRNAEGMHTETVKRIILVIRLGLMLVFIAGTFVLPSRTVSATMTVMAGSLGWILTPLDFKNHAINQARLWVGLILGWQFLHAYPVAGTQLTWGTVLWVPLVVTAVAESVQAFLNATPGRRIIRRTVVGFAVISLGILVWNPLRAGHYYFTHAAPLNLPGASLLRIPPHIGSGLRIISANATLHSSMLFSLPGSFSYNLWTHLPTPTGQNVTHWFTLLDAEKQTEIIDQMTHANRVSWIVQPGLLTHTRAADADFEAPLLSYWRNNFHPTLRIGGTELSLPKNYPAVMINTASYYRPNHADPADFDAGMIEVALVIPEGKSIDRVEIQLLGSDIVRHDDAHDWDGSNTKVVSRLIYPQGSPRGDIGFSPEPWPIAAKGLVQLRFFPQGPAPRVALAEWLLVFRDSAGNQIGEARFNGL